MWGLRVVAGRSAFPFSWSTYRYAAQTGDEPTQRTTTTKYQAGRMASQDQGPHLHPQGPIEVVKPKELTRGQFVYAYVPGQSLVDNVLTALGPAV